MRRSDIAGITAGLLLLASVLAHGQAAAGEMYQFAMFFTSSISARECALVQRFSAERQQRLSFPGTIDAGVCRVTVPRREFEKRFSTCFLAGINLYQAADMEMIECVFQERDDDYLFAAAGDRAAGGNSQVMCYFTCLPGREDDD